MTRADVEKFFSESKYSKYSVEIVKIVVRKFFKWMNGGKEYPDTVEGLGHSRNAYTPKEAKDMLKEEEINQLVDVCDDIRDRAMIRVLWDTACRVGELCNLKVSDVVDDNAHITVSLRGKTGTRTVGLTSSAPLVRQLLNLHKGDKESPLSISHSPRYYGGRIGENSVLEILQSRQERTTITKRITPHIVRHSRLCFLAKHKMSESIMRVYAGWGRDSSMPAVYLHMTDEDVNDTVLEIDTGAPTKPSEPVKSTMLPINCPRCQTRNDAHSKFCYKCWSPLQQEVMQRDLSILEMLRSRFIQFEGVDVEKILREYNQFKLEVNDIEKVLACFNGGTVVTNDVIQQALGLNTAECLKLLEYLVTAELIQMDDDKVILRDRNRYEQFLLMQKRYLEPV
ncbi:MAG TPA: site-specific integrase [Candidatus Thermoplasmatota archaeon]|nr:site-specific integrase [Candidatus Thermoplasmatota archaeon]